MPGLADQKTSAAPTLAQDTDRRVGGPKGSHQRAVHDDLGQTSYVRGQGCLELVIDIFPPKHQA